MVPGGQVVASGTVNFTECFKAMNSGSGNWYKCSDQHHTMNWNSVWPNVHRDIEFQLRGTGVVYIIFKTHVDSSWRYDGGSVSLAKLEPGGTWKNQWLGPNLRSAMFRGEKLVSTSPYADQPGPPPFRYRVNPDGKIQFWEGLSTFTAGQYRLTLTAALFHNNNTTEKTYYPCRSEYTVIFVPNMPVSSSTSVVSATPTQPALGPKATGKSVPDVWTVNQAGNVYRLNNKLGWTPVPGEKAQDIGVGADGSVWIVGNSPVFGGFIIYRWTAEKGYVRIDGGATRIDVGPDGQPWVVNSINDIYRRVGDHWIRMPGKARDIGIGSDGSVCIIGTNRTGNNYGIYRWNGSDWDPFPGAAVRIDVDASGNPWVANQAGGIYKWNGNGWNKLPGGATDISVGRKIPWVIGGDSVPGGHGIYKWDNRVHNWDRIPGGAVAISVGARPRNKPVITTSLLKTGTYNVEVNVGGTIFHSTWDIQVQNGHVTGMSHWPCCPGPRNDSLRGTATINSIRIQRDCSGQGWNGGCIQTYTGTIKGNRIEGTGTGTGLSGYRTTWTLFLN